MFLPAIEKGDMETARKAYADIAAAYADHRAVVDQMVARATEMNAATEVAAAESEKSFTFIIWSVAVVVFVVMLLQSPEFRAEIGIWMRRPAARVGRP